jgi:succinyl-CoA synthetase alpha subunit
VDQLSRLGIGGDPVIGTTFLDALALFEADPLTKAVVMVGEIGGSAEETAAELIRTKMSKPVVAFIAGQNAPAGKRKGAPATRSPRSRRRASPSPCLRPRWARRSPAARRGWWGRGRLP